MTSDWAIELHKTRMDEDEGYAAEYEHAMAIDAALEAEWFEQQRENELQMDWFADKMVDHRGEPVELQPTEPVVLIDDDLPF